MGYRSEGTAGSRPAGIELLAEGNRTAYSRKVCFLALRNTFPNLPRNCKSVHAVGIYTILRPTVAPGKSIITGQLPGRFEIYSDGGSRVIKTMRLT